MTCRNGLFDFALKNQLTLCSKTIHSCFLATYYFTQKLLAGKEPTADARNDVISFVRNFGSYLKLHTCLVHAASVHAADVVHVLLDLARHDPRHKELMKLGVKPRTLVFYEPVS